MIDKQTFKTGPTQERGGRQEVRALRHQAAVNVLEFAHTLREIGMVHTWLGKCVAEDAKKDLQGEIGCSATMRGITLLHFSEMCL